jgi:hypothetical protein
MSTHRSCLLLEGLSLHKEGISRIISRDKIQRRWVEISFITFRLAGFAALVFLVLPPEKAFAFLAVQLAVFGLYMGSSFAPNHVGMSSRMLVSLGRPGQSRVWTIH